MNKNGEGYYDPTAGKALERVRREEREREADISMLMTMIKQIISLAGFELVGRITIRDKVTGREYK